MKTKYRIVTDAYAGYEAQVKHWYFPFWLQINGVNTNISIEQVKALIANNRNKVVWHSDKEQGK